MSPRRKSVDSSGSSGDESAGSKKGYKDKKEKKDKGDKHSKDKKEKKDKDKKDQDKDKKSKDSKDKDSKDKDSKDKDKKDKGKDKDKKDKDSKEKSGDKKEKKDGKEGDKHKVPGGEAGQYFASASTMDHNREFSQFQSPPIVPPTFDANRTHPAPPPFPVASPPGYDHSQAAAAPPSGYRVPLTTTSAFPEPHVAGQPPCYDADGVTPIFIGSALFESSVHPCKIGPHLDPFASVAYGGVEYAHRGRYDLLPFVPQTMEWVPTSYGRIPPGRRAIEGGYEENGAKLYHGLAVINGVRVPGKTGEHLGACNVSFGGSEIALTEHEILCWR